MELIPGQEVEFNGLRRTVVRLADGQAAVPWSVKCYRPGCRRRKTGYLTQAYGNGAFYDRTGRLLADLRSRVFACPEHGIADGSAPFLVEDCSG